MSKKRLSEALSNIVNKEFPKHADSDVLENWLMKLLELDHYLVGIAEEVLSVGKTQFRIGRDAEKLRGDLKNISVDEQDQVLWHECSRYIDNLVELESALHEVFAR